MGTFSWFVLLGCPLPKNFDSYCAWVSEYSLVSTVKSNLKIPPDDLGPTSLNLGFKNLFHTLSDLFLGG